MRGWREMIRRRASDEELEKELGGHLELEAEEQQERGVGARDADYAARRALGNTTLIKEDVRALPAWNWLETVLQDVRFGARQLRRSPGFTAVAVLTLALGIGANTAIFTLVHAVMMKPLPVAHPEQLYNLGDNGDCCSLRGAQESFTLFSYPLYKEIREHTPEFTDMVAFQAWLRNVGLRRSGASNLSEAARAEFVTGNYFAMFGVQTLAGRPLTPADDEPGAPVVAVLSYRAWQAHFASDAGVVGSTLVIDRQPVTIVGVAEANFFGDTLRGDPPDLWLPLGAEPVVNRIRTRLEHADEYWLYAMGRLRPGASVAQARARIKNEIQHWMEAQPGMSEYSRSDLEKLHIELVPAPGGVANLQVNYAGALRFLTAVSSFVLLIACANIANLLLARSAANRRQIAMRAALGASRLRLMRQTVTEGLLLALLGGAAGVLLAFAGARAILLLAFRGATYVPIDATPSLPVLLFALAVSVLTGVVFSAAPAWAASHTRPLETLRSAGRGNTERLALPQKSLVVLQAALSLILLVGAGLATQSLRQLENQNFGFQTRGRMIVNVNSDLAGYSAERIASVSAELQERFRQIPGVLNASLSGYSPMEGSNWSDRISIAGHKARPVEEGAPSIDSVSAQYFETIGTGLLRGRLIDERDTMQARRVAVVNETFARKYLPGEDPLGQHFGVGDQSHAGDLEIVGVVEDTKYQDARVPAYPMAFLALPQAQGSNSNIFHDAELLLSAPDRGIQQAIQRTLASVDPNLTMIRAVTLEEQVGRNFNGDRLVARLSTLYGLLALTLACVGLYGVAAYTVTGRTSEIGVRMALGASRGSIVTQMLRSAMTPVGLGLLIGAPLALAGGRAIASQLYGVKNYDPLVLGGAVVMLTACSTLAAVIPSRRAASIDPMVALRAD